MVFQSRTRSFCEISELLLFIMKLAYVLNFLISINFCVYLFQVFFVIQFHHPDKVPTLGKIEDADPLMSCDLMDGRDAFLTLAREKHWEFSSLRRAKFSTMAMLVELHNQGTERFVYTCNECKRHVETRFHCTECEVSFLRRR